MSGSSETATLSVSRQLRQIVRDIGRQVIDVAGRAIEEDELREQGVANAAVRTLSPEVLQRQLTAKNFIGGISKMWIGFLLVVALLPLIVVVSATRNTIHFSVFAVYLPTMIIFVWARVAAQRVMGVKELLVRYAIGFTVEFTLVSNGVLVCALLGFVLYALVSLNAAVAAQDPMSVFIVYAAILTLAFVVPEESMKFVQVANFFPHGCLANPRQYNIVNVFATCGFATAQLIVQLLTFFAAIGYVTEKPLPDSHALQLLAIAVLALLPTHLLSLYHIGMHASKRISLGVAANKLVFMMIPIMFRAAQMYAAFFAPLLFEFGTTAAELTLYIAPLSIGVLYFLVVKCYEGTMPTAYLQSVGYLSCCGLWCSRSPSASTQGEQFHGSRELDVATTGIQHYQNAALPSSAVTSDEQAVEY